MVTNMPVCVTGASGFIAAHVVKSLLDKGYKVKGTVRSLSKPDKYSYLTNLPGAQEHLELIEAELLTTGSYDKAVEGCEFVIHTEGMLPKHMFWLWKKIMPTDVIYVLMNR